MVFDFIDRLYIKVTPYSSYSGTYQITFNAGVIPPGVPALIADTWANGSLAGSMANWYSFEATASRHYIHVGNFSTTDFAGSGVNVLLYDSAGDPVGSSTRLYGSALFLPSSSLTGGATYYVRVSPYSSSYTGTYRIVFNAGILPPGTTQTALANNIWANGDLATNSLVNWYHFTATASRQYIHVNFNGTLPSGNGVNVQLYDSAGNTVVYNTRLYGSTLSLSSSSLTGGATYHIKVTPYNSSDTGTYRIAFNAILAPPNTELAAGAWANGDLAANSPANWYHFTATASRQYIHVNFNGTLPSGNGVNVQLYNSGGTTVGNAIWLHSGISLSQALTSDQVYYIKITPYNSSDTGTYQIAFSAGGIPPGTTSTTLSADQWIGGNLTNSNLVNWYSFTATSAAQFIHFRNFSAGFTNSNVYVQLYDSAGAIQAFSSWDEVFYEIPWGINGTLSLAEYLVEPLTSGQVYYIKITPYNSSDTGTYQVAFSAGVIPPGTTPSMLTVNQWQNGILSTSAPINWYRFTATAATQYFHAKFGTSTCYIVGVELYDNAGAHVDTLFLHGNFPESFEGLTIGQEYYIMIRPNGDPYDVSYRILFKDNVIPPDTTQLTAGQWNSGTLAVLPAGIWDGSTFSFAASNWYRFTATAATHYIHYNSGNYISYKIYDSTGAEVTKNTHGAVQGCYVNVTSGQVYYIQAWQSSESYGNCAFAIAFNTSTTPPPN